MPGSELIGQLRDVTPPGQANLDPAAFPQLLKLTQELISARRTEAIDEHVRFVTTRRRQLCLPEAQLAARLNGAVILVTGGTGCIGSHLISQLHAYHPARIVSVSRGVTKDYMRYKRVEYQSGDIRTPGAMHDLVNEVRPDLIFHVAGQRDPGVAEVEVSRTITTNVFGTYEVLRAAADAGTERLVLASTGKAVRLYSPEVYSASKRVAEWLTAVASDDVPVSAARFTHIVDNSIVYRRLSSLDVIRLHSPDAGFYVQSATEAAQLLLLASLDRHPPGRLPVRAIRDLGWPVSLLNLALGVLADRPDQVPLYLSGYDPGYEEIPFPGLYDPLTGGDVSPLINAIEADAIVPSACPMTDVFLASGSLLPETQLKALERTVYSGNPDMIRTALHELCWALCDDTTLAAPRPVLERMAARVRGSFDELTPDSRRILRGIWEVLR